MGVIPEYFYFFFIFTEFFFLNLQLANWVLLKRETCTIQERDTAHLEREVSTLNDLEVLSIVETRAGKTIGNFVQMPQWETLGWIQSS